MELFLSGGGGSKDSAELDKKFASAVVKTKPLLYIPIAMDENRFSSNQCLDWLKSTFNPLGIDKIEMWTEKEIKEKNEAELTNFSGVYVGGGNTFYLLKELRESGFLSKLERLIKKNIPYYGGSAGAIICAKSIIPALALDKNEVNLENLRAMNLISGYDLWCHYVSTMDIEIQKYRDKYELKLIALPEDTGLHVTNDIIEVVGAGGAYLTNDEVKKIEPGQKLIP